MIFFFTFSGFVFKM